MPVVKTSFRSLVEGRRLHTRQLLSSLPLQSRYRLPLTLTSLLTRFPVRASSRRKAEDACDEDNLQKSCGRTKAAYKAAAEQLTPAEQVQAAFDLDQLANKVSSESEFEEESSLDFLQEGEVEQALLDENEIVLSIEKTSYNLFLYIIHY